MTDEFQPFHEAFLRRAAATPDAVAVEFEEHRLTYRELAQRSARFAAHLRSLGVGTDTVVGLSLERSAELVVALLGILRAGGAWVPLDPAYPADRLAYMLADSGVELVVTDQDPPWAGVRRVDPAAAGSEESAPTASHPDSLAYVIYTSGSTGRPKGVLLTHGGLANLAAAQVRTFGVEPRHRILQFAPTSFDASVFEIVMALHVGATLVLAPRAAIAPGPGLADLLRDKRITHVTVPPSVLATIPYTVLPDLETLICAGEALPAPLAEQWRAGRRLFNAYGPTETTVWATVAELADGGKPSIGTAIDGAHVVVLDAQLKPVPIGESGELAIGGKGVARGYLGRGGLTAERFIPDPFSPAPGGRLYRTGDQVRLHADGSLEFLGRIDHQVKINGFRIEPDEVAAVLREHPGVRDTVVVARPDAGGQRLVAYATGDTLAPAELRAFLADRLPAHMVPSAFVVLPELPLSPSGKVDRAALPAPDRHSAGLAAERVAPRTPTERALAQLVGELLGAEVGIDDDFFDLGGHSLLAGRLAARIRADLGRELPLARIYDAPTVAAMAALVDELPAGPGLPPIERVSRCGPLPLAFPQERIWYLEALAPGNLAYNAQATVRLRGPLDPDALAATLTEIVRRHEIFRTRFRAVDGVPYQEPQPPMAIPLPLVDLTGLPEADREARAEEEVRAALRDPFDLSKPPLARWLLIRHGDDDHTLVHVEHHLVHDGWSFAVFLEELQAIYAAIRAGRPSPLPELPYQFADFAAWQRNWLRGDVLDRHLDFWTKELAGSPPALDLPTDRPRPVMQSFEGAAVRFDLPPALCRRLREFSREHGVTLYTAMLAGFCTLLHRYSGQTDLLVGSGVANRRLAEVEQLMGMVVNSLVLRVDASAQPGFAELARRVHETTARAYDWQDTPFDRLVAALDLPRDPSRNPLFQVMFSFHDSPVPDVDFGGLRGTVLERHNGSAKTDLNIVVIPRAEQRIGHGPRDDAAPITLIWEYATDLFDETTMRRMVAHYQALLDAALSRPELEIARLPMLALGEEQAVDRSAAPYPDERVIHDLFADQVATRPDATAIVAGDTTLSYAELDARANQIAHLLRERGVGRDTPVGVLLERGAELIVVLLAALKAGGAYVPLDPAYPAERLGWMLADAAAPVVVTTSGLRSRLPADTVVIALDDEAVALAAQPVTSPASDAQPNGLAYLLYTSGSTGRPKAVMVEHRSVLRLVCGTDYVHFGSDERFAQVADASFDALTFELWGALLHGGAVCVIPAEALLTPGRLGEELRRHRVTSMFLTSALFNEVMATHPASFAGLTNLLVGGDALNAARIRQLLDSDAVPRRLLNGYGPTEATTFAVVHHIEHVPADATSVPIGRAIANTALYVLDAHLSPVPVGVPGELYIGGPGVARGYAGRPGLTADRFLPDPFATDGSRVYRTGDVVRRRADGVLDFLGRVDDQVKIRGFRIEPGEVEAALTPHPAVAQAAVLVDGDAGDRRLVAYVVAAGAAPSVPQLRSYLAERLPPYLLPAVYTFVPALPLTVHGKVDRAALPRPDTARPELSEGYVPPRNPTEERLAALAGELLAVDRVGVHDSFFALGGHSLLAMRLVAAANKECSADVPLRRFLQLPTVATLAAAVEETTGAGSGEIRPVAWRDAEHLLERMDELTDDEVEALLGEMAENEAER